MKRGSRGEEGAGERDRERREEKRRAAASKKGGKEQRGKLNNQGEQNERGSRNRPDARRTLPRIIEEEAAAAEKRQTGRVFNPFTSKDSSSARAARQVGRATAKGIQSQIERQIEL